MDHQTKTRFVLKTLAKTGIVHSLIFSLLISPVYAQVGTTGAILGQLQNTIGALTQQSLQQAQLAQHTAELQQYRAGTLRAPSSLFTKPDRFFGCVIPNAQGPFPETACRPPVQSPVDAQIAADYEALAILNVREYFDAHLSEARDDASSSQGLRCLEENRTRQVAELQAQIDSLRTAISNIRQANKDFENQNTEILLAMQNTNYELTGEGRPNDLSIESKPLNSYFSDTCQNVVGLDNFDRRSGFNGLKRNLESHRRSANNYTSNSAALRAELDAQINRITNEINTQGIDAWQRNLSRNQNLGIDGQTNFAGLGRALQREYTELDAQRTATQEIIQDLIPGYNLPRLGKHGVRDLSRFTNRAEDFFQKNYVNECVGLNENGIPSALAPFLNQLEQNAAVGSRGNRAADYRQSLIEIFQQDQESFIQDKLTRIRKLDQVHGKNAITFTGFNFEESKDERISPSVFLEREIARCQQRYKIDDTFAPTSSQGRSVSSAKQRARDAQEALTQFQNQAQTFVADIANSIRDQVENCNGTQKKTDACSASGSVFSTSEPGFCFAHANQCASETNGCYQEIQNHITTRENLQKARAQTYNQRITVFIANQRALLDNARTIAQQAGTNATEILKGFGNNDAVFELPQGLNIDTPSLRPTEFGVQLLGGNDLSFVQELPEKLESLARAIDQQKNRVGRAIDDYIDTQRNAIEENRDRWQNLAEQCRSLYEQFNEQSIAQQAQQQEQLNEQFNEAQQFCHKYSRLRNAGPGPGCEGDSSPSRLYEDASKVVAFVNPSKFHYLSQYERVCGQFQESRRGDDDDNEREQASDIVELCKENNDRWSRVKNRLIEDILSNPPAEYASSVDDIRRYLESGNGFDNLFDGDLNNGSYPNAVESLGKLLHGDNYKLSKSQFEREFNEIKGDYEGDVPDINRIFVNENGGDDNLCNSVKNRARLIGFKECRDNRDRSSVAASCVTKEAKDIDAEDLEADDPSELIADANRAISSVRVNSFGSQVTGSAWSDIGEEDTDACFATVGGPRGSVLGQQQFGVGQDPFNDFRNPASLGRQR